jgi:hypothetical protein
LCRSTYVNGPRRKFFGIFFKPLFILALPLHAATIPQAQTLGVAMIQAAIVRCGPI